MYDFEKKYSREDFFDFLNSLLPKDIKLIDRDIKFNNKFDLFKKGTLLAEVKSLNDLKIIEINHKASERNRISITKDLFRLMSQLSYTNSLIVTYTEKEDIYRISLITSSLEWADDKKIKKIFSDPKRYSFLVGPECKIHTPYQQLIRLGKVKDYGDLVKRFDIEVVNDEFFENYKNLYLDLKKYLTEDKIFSAFAKRINLEISLFSKKLLGQIIFCYFLQKKGWLGVPENKSFGSGDNSYLRKQFDIYNKKNKNFFNDFLEHFFYDGLNKKNDNDYLSHVKSKVPYIGGGLFEYYDGYDWKKENLNIPNSIFSNENKKGILNIFDLYNFTIDENEDLDVELSIDPEMLGRVFENLLEENLRKKGGSYYTPKSIVNFMCENSLINSISIKLNQQINTNDLKDFISNKDFDLDKNETIKKYSNDLDLILQNLKICDPAIGSGAFAVGMVNIISRLRNSLKKYTNRKYKNSIYYFKRDCIQNSIYGVDLDGSAVEITKLRLWLSLIVDENDYNKTEPLPNLDFQILQGNSLISQVDGYNFQHLDIKDKDYQFELLPNDVWEEFTKTKKKFINLKKKYFDMKNFSHKVETRNEIEKILLKLTDLAFSLKGNWNDNTSRFDFSKIRSNKNFFLWKLYFIEIFQEDPGFDIIIANPPYIGEKTDKEKFQEVKKFSDLKKYTIMRMDYFYYFFHLSLDLLKKNGILNFITTNYFTTATGGKKLRADLKNRSSFLYLINFNELKIFKSALGQHNMITGLIKNNEKRSVQIIQTNQHGTANDNLIKNILYNNDKNTSYKFLNSDAIFEGNENYIRLEGNLELGKGIENEILKKIKKESCPLIDLCNVNAGLVSGLDKITNKHLSIDQKFEKDIGKGVYVLNYNEYENLKFSKNELKHLKKLYKNSDIDKYYCKNYEDTQKRKILYLTRDLDISSLPNIKKHITNYEKIIKNRATGRGEIQAALKLGKWWVIFSARNKEIFEGEKIVCPQRSYLNTFGYDDGEFYASGDVYFITDKNKGIRIKYILSILNSKLYYFWLKKRGKLKGKMLELYYKPLTEIPIRIFDKDTQDKLISIVEKLIKIKNKNNESKKLEIEMNDIIYQNYNLSDDEIKFIEKNYP